MASTPIRHCHERHRSVSQNQNYLRKRKLDQMTQPPPILAAWRLSNCPFTLIFIAVLGCEAEPLFGLPSLLASAKIVRSEWTPGTTQGPFVEESASGLFVFTHEFLSGANSSGSPAIASRQKERHPRSMHGGLFIPPAGPRNPPS